MAELYHLLFTSMAREDLGEVELYDILIESAENNRKNGLTGMLAYRDGVFLETLEGDRIKVFEAYDRIMNDDRHIEVVLLDVGAIEERQFDTYKMCFESQLERTCSHTGHHMNCTEAKTLLTGITKPTKRVVELLTMIC